MESYPVICSDAYAEITTSVIDAYWQDYDGHEEDFIPAFLTNDILRLWRTFCVNYEAGTKRQPDRQKAKRKLKNFKLKHSRLLTCYSTLLYLLAVYREKGTVSRDDAIVVIRLTPTLRLERLPDMATVANSHESIRKLLDQYSSFLLTTNKEEEQLIDEFMDGENGRKYMNSAHEFGDTMFDVLAEVGNKGRLHRIIVV